jgi:hypothetical protein
VNFYRPIRGIFRDRSIAEPVGLRVPRATQPIAERRTAIRMATRRDETREFWRNPDVGRRQNPPIARQHGTPNEGVQHGGARERADGHTIH